VASTVGVDIGATMVRVAEVTGVDQNGYALVSAIGTAPLPLNAVVAGKIRSPKDVSIAIVRALRDAGVSRRGFILGLSTPTTSFTNMLFPTAVRSSERESAIRAMGKALGSSYSLEESVIATYLAGTSADQGANMLSTVGVASSLDEDVIALQAVCDLARCYPRAIDLSAAATMRSLVRVNSSAVEIGSVVDIGASKVTVATRQGMYLRSVRTTAGAGDDITKAIAGALRVSFEEAEELKCTMRLTSSYSRDNSRGSYASSDETTNTTDSVAMDALNSAADLLVDSVAQSVESSSETGALPQGVILCGGSCLLRGLKDRLQRRIGIPVSISRPWAELEKSKKNAEHFKDGKPDPALLISMATAIGLALWKEPL
jgi:type IV pilus assembly protein PilM